MLLLSRAPRRRAWVFWLAIDCLDLRLTAFWTAFWKIWIWSVWLD